jgi:hypothetical protein
LLVHAGQTENQGVYEYIYICAYVYICVDYHVWKLSNQAQTHARTYVCIIFQIIDIYSHISTYIYIPPSLPPSLSIYIGRVNGIRTSNHFRWFLSRVWGVCERRLHQQRGRLLKWGCETNEPIGLPCFLEVYFALFVHVSFDWFGWWSAVHVQVQKMEPFISHLYIYIHIHVFQIHIHMLSALDVYTPSLYRLKN